MYCQGRLTGGYEWFWVVIVGLGGYGVVTGGNRWLRMVMSGYGWLWMVIGW